MFSHWVNTEGGVMFRPDSLLLVTDPPCTSCDGECDHPGTARPKYFFWDKGALFEIKPPEKR